MSKKTIAKLITVSFVLMLVFFITAFANAMLRNSPPPPKVDCAQVTDADLAKTLYDKVKADSNLSDQLPHINFSIKDKVVTIEGWVAGKDRRKALEKLVKNTECVKKVKNKLKDKIVTGCPPGQKPCGEICIDKNSDCTIGNDQF